MERPTWATVVGILVIVFGCLGLMGSVFSITAPMWMDFQGDMIEMSKEAAREAMKESGQEGDPEVDLDQMWQVMDRFMNVPPWFGAWKVLTGIISLLLYGFYLFSGIMLLQMRSYSLKLLYLSFAALIAFSVANVTVVFASGSVMMMSSAMSGVFTIFLNVILLIVVLTADKTAFQAPMFETIDPEFPEHQL